MAKETQSRRSFLKKAAFGTVGTALGLDLARRVLDLWEAKAEHGQAALELHEMLTLAGLAAQIVPSDQVPGAREAGVVDFIDTKLKTNGSMRSAYQKGLREVDAASQSRFGKPFVSLDDSPQQEVLKSVGKTEFFVQVRRDVIEAFCRSSVGQRVMGYPGGAQPHGYHDPTAAPQEKPRLVRN